MTAGGDGAAAWSVVATVVEAIAVVVATGLAAYSIWKQRRDDEQRRAVEQQRAQEHRAAVDARISALAYALRRQLRSWVDEAPDEVIAIVAIVDAWTAAAKALGSDEPGEVPGVTHGMLEIAWTWASDRSRHFNTAEARELELMGAAPEASRMVAAAIRRAYVLFYRATGRLNRQVAVRGGRGGLSVVEIAAAYHELEAYIQALEPAIDPELRSE